jgi:hypothetical protein
LRRIEQKQPAVLSFDQTLNQDVYADLRTATFAYVDLITQVHLNV